MNNEFEIIFRTSMVDAAPPMKTPTAEPRTPTAAPAFLTTFLPLLFTNFLALLNCLPIDFFLFFRLLPFFSRFSISMFVLWDAIQ